MSLNITVTGTLGPGFIKIYPQGGSAPIVSTLNYVAGQTIANAAVAPLGTGGGATIVAGVSGTNLIIDTNGYYSSVLTSGNPFALSIVSSGPAMSLTNNSTSCVTHCGLDVAILGFNANGIDSVVNGTGAGVGVFGQSNTTGDRSAGVYGFGAAEFGAGATFGVYGDDRSGALDSAGVKGTDATGSPFPPPNYAPAGVRGDSAANFGVLGVSRFQGMGGSVVDLGGTELAWGAVGFNPGTVYGIYAGGDFGGSGAKYFVEPHPTDASKVIRYVALEGPEAGTYFRGRGEFRDGLATIDVPEDFRMVTDREGLSIQVTPIGEFANVAVVRIGLDQIILKATRDVEFFYTTNGVRKTHRDLKPIGPGNEFRPRSEDARIPAYLTEGQKAMLVSNGTYKEDGTVNLDTARQLGWDKAWRQRQNEPKPPQ